MLACLGLKFPYEGAGDSYSLAQALAFDVSQPSSIVASIMSARENARQVREQISSEMWEQINRLFHEVRRTDMQDLWDTSPHDFLRTIREGIHLLHGITDSTMTHGEGWEFLQLGRYLERASSVSTLIRAQFREMPDTPERVAREGEHLEWIGLLKCCTAFEAFCKEYTVDARPDRVAEFLILHPDFPHSIRFSAKAAESALNLIGHESRAYNHVETDRLVGRLRSTLDFAHIDEILSGGIHSFLEGIERQVAQIHGAIHYTFIEYPIESALAG
jgi:uncharacterized alpha-E superfamily protein